MLKKGIWKDEKGNIRELACPFIPRGITNTISTGPSKYEVFAVTDMRGGPGNVGAQWNIRSLGFHWDVNSGKCLENQAFTKLFQGW